jgi:hypothetical protein
MFEDSHCPSCGTELTGAIESTFAKDGAFVVIISQETSDCNWTRCKGCGSTLCKSCHREQPNYCCDEDRIVDRERAQAKLNGHGSFADLMTRSSDAIKRLDALIKKPTDTNPDADRR